MRKNVDLVWNNFVQHYLQRKIIDRLKSVKSKINKLKVLKHRSYSLEPICFSSIQEFKKQTEEKLQKKLESAKENRERVLQAKVEKAKAPIEKGFASVQQNLAKLEEERQLLQEKINQKLNTAETSKNLHSAFCFDFSDLF